MTGSATFVMTRQTVDVSFAGTAGAAVDLNNAQLLTVSLDSGGERVVHWRAWLGGLRSLPGLCDCDRYAGSASHDTRQYIAIASTVGGAALQGLPEGVGVSVTNLAVAVNKAIGTGATPLDWSRTSTSIPMIYRSICPPSSLVARPLASQRTTAVGSVGTLTLNLLDFVTATADFAFRQTTVDVNVGLASWIPMALALADRDLAGAQETMLNLSIHDLFAGDPNSIGFSVASGSLAIGIITPSATAKAAGDDRVFFTMQADLTGVTPVGLPMAPGADCVASVSEHEQCVLEDPGRAHRAELEDAGR